MKQQSSYQLAHQGLGALPIVQHFIQKMGLVEILEEALTHPRYVEAILLLVKNILTERGALYAIHEWSAWYDPTLIHGGKLGDDTIARALDRLFSTDRASLLTRIVVTAAKEYDVDLSEIHQDTTTISVTGAYTKQNQKATQLKRGHSKDHRPDLKQLVYALSVTRDGAVPVHFKTYDGNRTDDTLHWETWQTLRGILGRSDFLYVADSKLCSSKTLMNIDRNQGRFVTILPKTRAEVEQFREKILAFDIRWEKVYAKRSSRKIKRIDLFEASSGLSQMREGFRIYWYRSSEKSRRDHESREERIAVAMDRLRMLNDPSRKKRPKTEAALKKRAEKILSRSGATPWIHTEITHEKIEEFKQKTRGRATQHTDYRKLVRLIPQIRYRRNHDAIAHDEVMDGIFPLATNTNLSALETLKSYKYQPTLEKRHRLFKTVLHAAPVFLKKNDRIEALMFTYFIAQTIMALIERQLRIAMKQKDKQAIQVLPEGRPSKQPTTEQVFRLFENHARRVLFSKQGKHLQTFSDPLIAIQKEVLGLLMVPLSVYN